MTWDWLAIFVLIKCTWITHIPVDVSTNVCDKLEIFVCSTRPTSVYWHFSYYPISLEFWLKFQWCIASFHAWLHWKLTEGWRNLLIMHKIWWAIDTLKWFVKNAYYWNERSVWTAWNYLYSKQYFFLKMISVARLYKLIYNHISFKITSCNIISCKRRWYFKPCLGTKEK